MPVPGAERACVHASIALSPRGVRGVTQVRVAHEQRPAPPPASATGRKVTAHAEIVNLLADVAADPDLGPADQERSPGAA
jgi:hypothetical protein